MSNPPISDEIVMAYADGELDAAACEELEWQAEHDGAVAQRVIAFLRSRRLVKSALPVRHDALAADFMANVPNPSESASENVVAMRPKRRGIYYSGAAIAACAIGIFVGAALFDETDFGSPASALETRPSQQALDTLMTGEESVSGSTRLRAVATYLLSDGQVCREVTVTVADRAGDAVVCRNGSTWSTRIAVIGPASSDYETAGGDGDAVDGYLRQIHAGDALSPEAEKAVLADS